MKYCPACESDQDDSSFYSDKAKRDGLSSSCRVCTKSRVARYKQSAIGRSNRAKWESQPRVRARTRELNKSPKRLATRRAYRNRPEVKAKEAAYGDSYARSDRGQEVREKYRATDERKESLKRYEQSDKGRARKRAYRDANLNEAKAREALNRATRFGKMTRGPCAHLSDECAGLIEGHHHNGYDKAHWLDVLWLCRHHHRQIHRAA